MTDAQTGAPLEGVSLIVSAPSPLPTAITDEDGRFHLPLPPGRWTVTAFYADVEVEATAEVRRGGTTAIHVRIAHEAIVDADRKAAIPSCPTPRRPSTDAERIELVSAAVERLLADRGTLLSGANLPRSGTIDVLIARRRLPSLDLARLPPHQASMFAARTYAELQAEADDLGATLFFLTLPRVEIAGSCASVKLGVVQPSRSTVTMLCCCAQGDLWAWRDGRWVFTQQAFASCS